MKAQTPRVMSTTARLALATINETATDWLAVCPVCSETLSGSLADLRKHRHGPAEQAGEAK